MSHTQIRNVIKSRWASVCHLAAACALLIAFAGAPLHAQYNYQDLHEFNCTTDGCNPAEGGPLVEGSDLYLYGTTSRGGANGTGTIFKVSPDGTSFIKLWDFDNYSIPNGGPVGTAALTLASDGYFYGVTWNDGNVGNGTLFRIGSSTIPGSASPGPPTILRHFDNTDGNGAVEPIQARDGNLYGVTGNGITYRFTLATQTYELVTNSTPGEMFAPLLLASNGYLYGAAPNAGTIFTIGTSGGAAVTIHNFTGADGSIPLGPLTYTLTRCGKFDFCIHLYGTASEGGANGTGNIFEVSPGGAFTVLHSFDPSTTPTSTNNGGGYPGGLLLVPNGQLLGVSTIGGADGWGTIYQVSTSGSFVPLFDFTGSTGTAAGDFPSGPLMQHTNGCFYGLTFGGATSSSYGDVYDLCPSPTPPFHILMVEGPIFVLPGVPVEIIGSNMEEVSTIAFGGVQAQFQPGSDTYLMATVPMDAVDGVVTATFPSGTQVESATEMYILPLITNLDPTSGPVGQEVDIVGGGFSGATRVGFGGVKATSFTVLSPSLIQATVPPDAKTGKVTVTTPHGTATSKQTFTVN
jgi:uncharacterized repeat protein (TIGR03803 family)